MDGEARQKQSATLEELTISNRYEIEAVIELRRGLLIRRSFFRFVSMV